MSNTELPDASANQDVNPESSGTVPAERHPNLTLLESGQNPGEILRAAREKMGYSLSDVSEQTKINQRQLEAIESGDIGRLPPETFAKAFIKSYCKVLKIDAAPIIASFGFTDVGAPGMAAKTGQADANRGEPLEPKMPSNSKRLSSLNFDRKTGKKSLSYGLVLAAVAIMAVFYIPAFLSNQSEQAATEEPVANNEAPVSQVAQDQQSSDGLQAPLNGSNGAVDASVFPALQPSTEPTETAADSSSPLAVPADSSTATTLPGGSASTTPESTASAQAAEQSATAPTAAPEVAATSPAAGKPAPAVAPTPAGTKDVMRITFQGQSWVTVRDAKNKVLVSQLNPAGTNLEVNGVAPFKVIIGNAKSVKVTHNGKEVDLKSSTKGGVARITIR